MVRIRLKRMGRIHLPAYRVTVVDGRATRDGKSLEEVGFYAPCHKHPDQRLSLNTERIAYWLGKGAQPSETVAGLLRQQGIKAQGR